MIDINSSTIFTVFFFLIAVVVMMTSSRLIRYGGPAAYGLKPDNEAKRNNTELLERAFKEHIKTGNSLYQEYCYENALYYYLEASKIKPDNTLLTYRIGRLYLILEEYARAEVALKKVLEITPDFPDALYDLAYLYFKRDMMESAMKYTEQLLRWAPKHMEGKKLKAHIYLESNQLEAARELINAMLKESPENVELIIILGMILQRENRFEEALLLYQEALEKDPDDKMNLKYHIYQIRDKQGHFDQAIEALQDIYDSKTGTIAESEIRMDLAKAYSKKASALLQMGHTEEAIDCYQQASGYNALYSAPYYGLGQIYEAQNDLEGAIVYYKKVLDVEPTAGEMYLKIALLYDQLGKYDEAIACINQGESVLPAVKVSYYLGLLCSHKGDFVEAVSQLSMAISRDSAFIEAYFELALTYEKQKKFKDAIHTYRKLLEIEKEHPEAKANLKQLQARLHII